MRHETSQFPLRHLAQAAFLNFSVLAAVAATCAQFHLGEQGATAASAMIVSLVSPTRIAVPNSATIIPSIRLGKKHDADAMRKAVTVSPAAPAPVTPSTSGAHDEYVSRIRQLIESRKTYPEKARSEALAGDVEVWLAIARDGHLIASRVLTPSGYAWLDAEAIAVLYRIGQFPPLPAWISPLDDHMEATVTLAFGPT